jgi:tetratricopeptide (TPR) repeat protein
VIAARIDLLEPDEKRAIQDASVVGRTFWEGAVERIVGGDVRFDGLLRKGLVHEVPVSTIAGERPLVFSHVLIREVAYRSIPKERRRRAHAEAGAWIEEHVGGRSEDYAEILAHHAELAGDHARTARYAALAGRRKLRVFEANEAIAWFERAMAASEASGEGALRARSLLDRGRAFEQLARFPDAEADFRAAVACAVDAGEHRREARAMASLAHVLWLQDRYDEGRKVLDQALESARVYAPDLEAWLLYTAGTIAFGRGEWKDSIRYQQDALTLAEESGDREDQALAQHGLSETLLFSASFREALEHGHRSSELLRDLEQWPMYHHNEYTIGWILMVMGRFEEALRRLDESIAGVQEFGDQRNEVHARSARGVARSAIGDLGGAIEEIDECLRIAGGIRSIRTAMITHTFACVVMAEVGDFERVAGHAAEARRLSDQLGGRQLRPRLLGYEAWCALQEGRREEAERLTDVGDELLEGALWESMAYFRVSIMAWGEAGDGDRVAELSERLCRLAEGESVLFEAWGEFGRSWAQLLGPEPERAVAPALRGLDIAREIGDVTLVWRLAGAAAEAYRAIGKAEEARPLHAEASEAILRIGDSLPPRRRESFLALPWIRRVLEGA